MHALQESSDLIGLEAAEWLARLTDEGLTPEESTAANAEFREWLTRSPRHVALLLETYETYSVLGNISRARRVDVSALLAEYAEQNATLRHNSAIELVGPGRRGYGIKPPLRVSVRLAFVVLVAALCLYIGWDSITTADNFSVWTSYSTGVGEIRTVSLEDGSRLTLNTHSLLQVAFAGDRRRARLISGEVLLDIHHEPHRPFVLEADDVRILDLGTVFDVYRSPAELKVVMVDGRAQVSCACGVLQNVEVNAQTLTPGSSTNDLILTSGNEVKISVDRGTGRFEVQNKNKQQIARTLAWKQGLLSFDGQTLPEVADEFNRYNTVKLVIVDSDLLRLRVGGTFKPTEVDKALAVLQKVWRIQADADPQNPNIIRLKRANEKDPGKP